MIFCTAVLSLLAMAGCTTGDRPPARTADPAGDDHGLAARVDRVARLAIGIDAHNHVDVPLAGSELPGPAVDLSGDFAKSGLSAISMTFAVDYQKLTRSGEAFERFLNGLEAMDSILAANSIRRASDGEEVRRANEMHQPIVIQSVEGGHFLEGRIDRLRVAYARGLRHLGLLHDSDASTPLGDIYTNPPRWGGLTAFGAEVVRECERLGILVDLTHCDDRTVDMALAVATKPMIISHTGLDTQLGSDPRKARIMRPRLISAETARKVAKAGGVIGVWTHLSDTPMEYARNIRAMVDVVGVDHVGIGTDTKLTPPYRGPPDTAQPGPHVRRIGERTELAWDGQQTGFYRTVVEAMVRSGFSDEEIAKISGENYLRVFTAATRH